MKETLTALALAGLLAGCASQVPAKGIAPPAKMLMRAPEEMPLLPKNAGLKELYASHIELKKRYGTLADRTRGLQAYARAVTK